MITPDYTALEESIGKASLIIEEANKDLSSKLSSLTEEIKAASNSSSRLATVMVWLTYILGTPY
jgi:hypothetical protein